MDLLTRLHWLGHASFRIESADGRVIYLDPWKLRHPRPADVVLITHGHGDHLSPADIALIRTPETVFVVAAPYARQISGDVRGVAPGDVVSLGEARIESVHSYNTDKPNHPAGARNVGYVVDVDGVRYYHAGDTDVIPEMANVRCDVALLPCGGTYTMDASQTIEAIRLIKPRVVVPMHWGDIVGSADDANRVRLGAPSGVEVVLLAPEA
jgi:L-ascorbate metabolism protein UlaG (beta-lactamase superfamily)